MEYLNNKQLEELNSNYEVIDTVKYCLLMIKGKNCKKIKVENELTKYNSKTHNLEKFKEFIKNKNKINGMLFDKYNKVILRKYKRYWYLNSKYIEIKMIREIKNTFGKDSIILFGNFCFKTNCHKVDISTQNNILKRLTWNKRNHKTEKVCENLYLPDANEVITKITFCLNI